MWNARFPRDYESGGERKHRREARWDDDGHESRTRRELAGFPPSTTLGAARMTATWNWTICVSRSRSVSSRLTRQGVFVLFVSRGEIFVTCDNADKKIDMKLNLTFLCVSTIYQSRVHTGEKNISLNRKYDIIALRRCMIYFETKKKEHWREEKSKEACECYEKRIDIKSVLRVWTYWSEGHRSRRETRRGRVIERNRCYSWHCAGD